MKNEVKGRDIFYGVVALATLIVAIIGATLAYFSIVTSSSEGAINATAAVVTIDYKDGQQVTAQADKLVPASLAIVKKSYETYIVNFAPNTAVDVVYDSDLLVYPNPTMGVLNFSEELSNVRVFDVTGRMVYAVSDVVRSVDLNEIVGGVYFLVAEKDGEQVSTKIVKK